MRSGTKIIPYVCKLSVWCVAAFPKYVRERVLAKLFPNFTMKIYTTLGVIQKYRCKLLLLLLSTSTYRVEYYIYILCVCVCSVQCSLIIMWSKDARSTYNSRLYFLNFLSFRCSFISIVYFATLSLYMYINWIRSARKRERKQIVPLTNMPSCCRHHRQ